MPGLAILVITGRLCLKAAHALHHPVNTADVGTAIQSDEQHRRGRFREIFCRVLEARKGTIPDYRDCEEAISRVGQEPAGIGRAVNLGPAQRRLTTLFVPGIGWDCFSTWLALEDTIPEHLRQFGYDMVTLDVDGLSASEFNTRLIRDAILEIPREGDQPDLVLVGYSKGAPDVLEALVSYPEIHHRVAAMVSAAGSVGGSPLANDARDDYRNLLQYFPGATCKPAGEGALYDLRPDTRKAWLAKNKLPEGIPFYSLMTFPKPKRISSILVGSYKKIGRVDARNDGQVIFYDQFNPGSTLLGYLNADHWALAVPIARSHDRRCNFRRPERLSPRGPARGPAQVYRGGSAVRRELAHSASSI